jgi:hypothetical protein
MGWATDVAPPASTPSVSRYSTLENTTDDEYRCSSAELPQVSPVRNAMARMLFHHLRVCAERLNLPMSRW